MRCRCDPSRAGTGLELRLRVTRAAAGSVTPAAVPGSAVPAARTAPAPDGTPRRLPRGSAAPVGPGLRGAAGRAAVPGPAAPPGPCLPKPRSKPSPCAAANSRLAVSIRLPALKLQRGSGRRNPPWPCPARRPPPAAVSVSARGCGSGAALPPRRPPRRLCPAAGFGQAPLPGAPRLPCPPCPPQFSCSVVFFLSFLFFFLSFFFFFYFFLLQPGMLKLD